MSVRDLAPARRRCGLPQGASATVARLVASAFMVTVPPGVLALPSAASAQSASQQVWVDATFDFPRREGFLFELDVEPKLQYAGDDTWRAIDVTPAIEWSVGRWVEVVGEALVGRTKQSSRVSSYEVTPRAGLRVHLFNNLRTMLPGRHLLGRVGIANLTRLEWRNLRYSDGSPSAHEARLRNRLELKVGINHAEMSRDRTLYFAADVEFFAPLTDDVEETFASKARARTGLGYRHDDRWRYEFLYIRDGTRETGGQGFARSANIIDFRLKMFFE